MNLKNRVCQLGVTNNRLEFHGEDAVPAIDIPITGFAIVAGELNEITGDLHAHRALFDSSKSPVEPIFNCFKPLHLEHKFEDCTARFLLGLGREELVLANAKVASVKLDPALGGMTSMDFKIQFVPDDLAVIPKLLAFAGHEIELSIDLGKKAEKAKGNQQNLPLDEGKAEVDEDDEREAA